MEYSTHLWIQGTPFLRGGVVGEGGGGLVVEGGGLRVFEGKVAEGAMVNMNTD